MIEQDLSDNITLHKQVFIEQLIASKMKVSIFLANGIRLRGTILHDDMTALLLQNDSLDTSEEPAVQLIYKQNISSIMPETDVII